ncbi:PTS sugar transporter subunit IIC [Vibrio mediterranei]|jgi:PTS system N-acetylgalactosamine-specific IIC component|uniref:PTS N-acetylgalactosamine transporter subunit IIC n=1 Tax=Vibrio mediterranei TaxID=689 RepID=UPI0004E21811|nr:PTS N-acetylgalactosamine transporter subunit IIC [Vibrio mediterranei]MCG9628890.1 PTS sugar transporter subunit IIC [Vibrio mediterranei]MCY9855293.1 PTS N-acetylgalactosamine transporter subunit IIC [Vibrio mediterranei]NUW72608.1 PTS sugar transporter subunit IIC [Vibrio mediterranei]
MDILTVLAISVWVGLAGVDYYGSGLMFGRPIVTGTVVGFLMGDMQTGLEIGATLELAWLGLMPLAGAQPPNVTIGSAVGVVFGIQSGLSPTAVVGVAIPFAILMQQLTVIQFTTFATFMPKVDKMAEKCDIKGIEKVNYLGLATYFLTFFICTFVPTYFGDVVAKSIVESVPKDIIDGLSIAGAMMPALGFSMLLKMMLKEKRFTPFYVIGFVLATFLKLPIIAVALLALSVAIVDYFNSRDSNNTAPLNSDDHLEDGI